MNSHGKTNAYKKVKYKNYYTFFFYWVSKSVTGNIMLTILQMLFHHISIIAADMSAIMSITNLLIKHMKCKWKEMQMKGNAKAKKIMVLKIMLLFIGIMNSCSL